MSLARAWMVAVLGVVTMSAAACKGDKKAIDDDETLAPPNAPGWRDVEQAAAGQVAPGPADELVRALTLVDGGAVPDPLRTGTDPARDAEEAAKLPQEARDAVAALIRWDQADGRLPARDCNAGASASPADAGADADARLVTAPKLARLALLLAGADPEAPAVRAAVRLAARHRAEGLSLLEAMVGAAISESYRRWATERGLRPGPTLRGYEPTDASLQRIVAAEAVCSMSLYGSIRGSAWKAERDAIHKAYKALTRYEEHRALVLEGEALQAYWVETLADLRGRAADPAATDRRMTERADKLRRKPEDHPVVALLAPPTVRVVERLRKSDDEHRAWLAGTAPPSGATPPPAGAMPPPAGDPAPPP